MKGINKRTLLYAAVLLSLIFSLAGLTARLAAERNNKTVGFVADQRDISSLAFQNGISTSKLWGELHKLGLMGLAVPEYTGDELAFYNAMPVSFGSAVSLMGTGEKLTEPNRAVIKFPGDLPYAGKLSEYLKIKLPGSRLIAQGAFDFVILPGTVDEFKFSTFVPDFQALDFCAKNNIPVLFRPGPCTPASGKSTAAALTYLADNYPQIKNIIPAGLVAPGYPDVQTVAEALQKKGITLSQVEFIKQVGVPELARKMGQLVIPMHSLTRDEVISRNINRTSIYDRYIRAIHERSIRLLMVRPYDLQMGDRLEVFKEDLKTYKEALASRGYTMAFPKPIPFWGMSLFGALACGLIFLFTFWFYLQRLAGLAEDKASLLEVLLLFVGAFALGAVMWKLPFSAKLLGGFIGAFAATEASLTALESSRCRIKGALVSFVMVLAGGLAIASFYGSSAAALRLTPFSGVKLTLLLPPLLLLAHDLARRVHPESIGEIVERPALWGELVVIGLMLGALLVMALRSDNVSNVPALEVAFRDFMEKVMLVRPRTKEFLIGYPALVLYWFLVRNNLMPHYREVIRIAAALAFSSAVNTFCHFHTLLYLSVIRDFNGWWLGLLLGAIGVLCLKIIILPLVKKSAEIIKAGNEKKV